MDDCNRPLWNIVGERVALGPRRRDLLPVYTRWVNDFEITRMLAMPLAPMSLDEEEAWYNRPASETDRLFTVYERETGRPIGNTGLHRVDHVQRTALFGILIGEKDCWGRGFGTETTRLMLDYAFHCVGVHNVLLAVYGNNPRAYRAYLRAGFKEIGRRREARRVGQAVFDEIYMDCLATEFESPQLHRLASPDYVSAPAFSTR